MIEQSLTEFFLTGVITYGAPALGLALLLAALGVPLPSTFLVIATGAFVRQGVINWGYASFFGVVGAVVGDSLSFGIGRAGQGWVQRRFGKRPVWQRSRAIFDKRGGAAIYLTRFLLTPLAIPTNLIAGSSTFPFRRFVLFVVAGEITWIGLFGGLGYFFGSQWELIGQFVSDFSGLLVGIAALGAGVYFWFRRRKRFRKAGETKASGEE